MNEMEKAYRLAAAAVRQRFAEQHPERLAALDRVTADDVAVYKGTYDSVEEVLKRLGVPHRMDPKPGSSTARIHFGNCSSTHDAKVVDGLREAVEAGAQLVTSDWALASIVEAAFPNTLRRKAGKHTRDEVVAVEPGTGSHWSEVVVLGADPQWWLESSSYPIEVLDPARVRIEAASHELLKTYDAPVVAASFDWEEGRGFHVISHFWLKRSRTPDVRYAGPAEDFLRAGMRLSEAGIEASFREAKVAQSELNFAAHQSAATATELIAQLCVRAVPERLGPVQPKPANAGRSRREMLANPLAALTTLLSGRA